MSQGEVTRPSLLRDSAARIVAEVLGALAMLLTGMVTARTLGPDGKGVIASLSYLLVLLGHLAVLGLGDAAVVAGSGRASLRSIRSLGTTVLMCSVGAASIAWRYGLLVLPRDPGVQEALFLVVLAIPVWGAANFLTAFVNSRDGVVYASGVHAAQAACTALVTLVAVYGMRAGVLGAAVGLVIGPILALLLMTAWLVRSSVDDGPTRAAPLRAGLRFGIPAQAAVILQVLSARVDVLIVLVLTGVSTAGHYSVATTASQLVMYAPYALSMAAFPKVARTTQAVYVTQIVRLSRLTLAGSGLSAGVLCVVLPFAMPLAYGPGFKPSVAPALYLLPGAVLGSLQWILARALAARGNSVPLLRSYAASIVAMIALDLWLVPAFGMTGAALAVDIAAAVGLLVIRNDLLQMLGDVKLSAMLPRAADIRETMLLPMTVLLRARRALRHPAEPRSDQPSGDKPVQQPPG